MPSLRDRLREWWRYHYMEGGFGSFVPGFQRRLERDLQLLDERLQELADAYPVGWSVAFYNGEVLAAPTDGELSGILLSVYQRDCVPEGFRMAPRHITIHRRENPLLRRVQ